MLKPHTATESTPAGPSAPRDLQAALTDTAAAVGTVLDRLLPTSDGPEARLFEAMRYATLNGGKRLRPFLVTAGADLFDVPRERSLRAAAAVEFIHCYSLVHDDLPAMDDDDLRRGRPTCHIQFDEATAILAGDALLTLAFEVLADPATHPDPAIRVALVGVLAAASGGEGMVGGQMFDLVAEGRTLDLEQITRLQALKTGRLIKVSCAAGAGCSNSLESRSCRSRTGLPSTSKTSRNICHPSESAVRTSTRSDRNSRCVGPAEFPDGRTISRPPANRSCTYRSSATTLPNTVVNRST